MTLGRTPISASDSRRTFSILGRDVLSDIPLRGLPRSAAGAVPDIRVIGTNLERAPHTGWAPFVHFEDASGIHFSARDVGQFHISTDGGTVSHSLLHSANPGDVHYLLTGPILSLALQQRGEVLIHAAAVAKGLGAIAFAGPHAAGKSTLAASFASVGGTLLTDDILPVRIDGTQIVARRSVPWIKLNKDSLDAVGERNHRFDPVWSKAEKRRVPMRRAAREGTEYPIAAIYLLDPSLEVACTRIVAETPVKAAARILANTYAADKLIGLRAAFAMDAATRIAETVPVRAISYFRSFENLPAIREAILRDVEELTHA